ncbi:MAG: sulfatase [Alistipes sp.]|nr:sulfatase [Alistipes sp.]
MKITKHPGLLAFAGLAAAPLAAQQQAPNILYIMSDDHSSQTIGVYADVLRDYVHTPNIDRIAREGVRMDACMVTNSISTPSRGAILTGQYSHHNGVYTLADSLPAGTPNVAKELQRHGYATAIIGKWHLGTQPEGFDYYAVMPGQGQYTDPVFLESGRSFELKNRVRSQGYCTDVITDKAIDWMEHVDRTHPFLLMCHFKAPHTPFTEAPRHEHLYDSVTFPEPANLYDDYAGRPTLKRATLKVENNRQVDKQLPRREQRRISYQDFIRRYLRCIAAVDENVGRLLNYLDESGLAENTVVIYTSDQGFFMGEHGLWDKRLMLEESLRMPLLIRYPREIPAGSVNGDLVQNTDFAPTLLDYAGAVRPDYMDGRSFRANLRGETPADWRQGVYYRYWMNFKGYNIPAHYGIRTRRYKLIYYYGQTLGMSGSLDRPDYKPVWELYDLENDPAEMINCYGDPQYRDIVRELKEQLQALQAAAGDIPVNTDNR